MLIRWLMRLLPPLAGTQLSPVAPRSWLFPVSTSWATVITGGLNQVRVTGVVSVFTPGTSAPFPLLFPIFRPPCPSLSLLFPAHSSLLSYISSSSSPFSSPLFLQLPLPFSLSH
ncbi:unnamed protein product [Schistocephalus solidus]|uniref:Secreted protein n=1 Tax=Schistocephalus solidus TaxID=70667 RepID=A0A183T644_SCHSO|nr:unnamed protein product [Schistocephalus solidus]